MATTSEHLASRAWLLAGPAAAATAAVAVLAKVDPAQSSVLPPCPFHAITGQWCPGCGSTRALHQLLNGDVAAAAGLNPLMVASVPFVVVAAVVWTARRAGLVTRRPRPIPSAVSWVILGTVLAFWALRNLPFAPFSALAP